jgi:hypothetical protein
MKLYTFAWSDSNTYKVPAHSLEQAETSLEIFGSDKPKLQSISKLKFRGYTEWLLSLVGVILADANNKDLTLNDIALGDYLKSEYYDKGLRPEHVYTWIWEGDAGNYWAI